MKSTMQIKIQLKNEWQEDETVQMTASERRLKEQGSRGKQAERNINCKKTDYMVISER